MPVEAQALPDERIELPRQKVGEPEGAYFLLSQGGEPVEAAEKGVAVRSFDPGHAFGRQDPIELATRAAVAIGHDDPLVRRPVQPDSFPDRLRDQLRVVVQLSRKAVKPHMVEPVGLDQGQDLTSERAAGKDQGADRHRHDRLLVQKGQVRSPRRAGCACVP
ncbi:MAG TPA: hypothetical protein VHL31_25515 [Geminicoccus sp.]|nr:hypothetical protein [Geminicoccus sp.]HEX2529635.1 hypothetical protein [Geminicoccus sp.]